ncbi:MAG TPA: ATP-binding protein [Anaerolineae bacterium]
MTAVQSLAADALYRHCDPSQFSFETTDQLASSIEIIGQERAVAAIRFGVGIEQEGYNLFALGPGGTGKYTAVHKYLEEKAAREATPPDWCYVHNFEQEHQPHTLRLPPGRGIEFKQDMDNLLDELFAVIPAAFESEEYQAQRHAIAEELQQKQEESLETLTRQAREQNIALVRTQAGLAFAPMRDGEVLAPDEFMKLSEEERQRLQEQIEVLQDDLQKVMRQMPNWSRQMREKLKELNQEVATLSIAPLVEEIRQKYQDLAPIQAYLEAVQDDVTDNIDKFLQVQAQQTQAVVQADGTAPTATGRQLSRSSPFFNRYRVNLIVDHSQTEGAPVVLENHPVYPNLIGRVEHVAQMGALLTDFTLIKAGALHRANGGYLILDARKLLLQPYAWESLKRALQANEIRIESLGQMLSLISTVSLEPEPIPLDVKIVLLGDRLLYYLLYQFDPDFDELFKVMADFETEMARNEDNNMAYALLISSLAQKNDLRPFDRSGVARVIEYGSRLVSDVEKLSIHIQSINDLLSEASYWAGEAGSEVVSAAHVQQAIDAQTYRSGRLRERMQEAILRDTVLIDTSGERVGQINGLSVLSVGNFAFGRPSRITARVRMGKGEVIDIERQVEMGGPIHSKGVLILSGFLGGRYAEDRPLSLNASLVFEQSYAGVEGDSASSAELYALLSALAEVPIKQSFAVTGSVNQHGQVQAIGGVNEKIEGFFDICNARGLSGEQGVLIPQSNVKNLMLRWDVVSAVAKGQFHIYPVETIDQGIELLTGLPAGQPDEEGNYPEGTFNHKVAQRLADLAEKQREFSKAATGEEEAET